MSSPIMNVVPVSFQWPTLDPFLFCVYHDDKYPRGNDVMGPDASLEGRHIGQDFAGKDGWRMYHGDVVPGFPKHPHRGFETITLVRKGRIDHSDSLGATARFGGGDVQWMTAGRGIEHCEMFPLLSRDEENPLELFQIWLNLPASDKMVDPYFTMLWNHEIPRRTYEDSNGIGTELVSIVGSLDGQEAPPPPPNSWASRDESGMAIWTIRIPPGGRFTLPEGPWGTNRVAYLFKGKTLSVAGRSLAPEVGIQLHPTMPTELVNGEEEAELLVLQARPIGEPVARRGPFVMNTQGEIRQAYADYHAGTFGRWPWDSLGPVHDRGQERFAIHADGRREVPPA